MYDSWIGKIKCFITGPRRGEIIKVVFKNLWNSVIMAKPTSYIAHSSWNILKKPIVLVSALP